MHTPENNTYLRLLIGFLVLLSLNRTVHAQHPNIEWLIGSDCVNGDQVLASVFDKNGDIIVGGYFSGGLTLGGNSLSGTGGSQDFFLAKYSPQGNCLWAISGGGTLNDQITCIAVDDNNDIIIAGAFQSSSMSIDTTVLTNNGSWDSFIASVDDQGNYNWARQFNSTGHDNPTCIEANSNSILIGGNFEESLIAEGDTLLNSGTSGFDGYLVKLNLAGDLIWSNKIGGTSNDKLEDVAFDDTGNIYCVGIFGNADIQLDTIILTNQPGGEIFTAKYNTSGFVEWAKSAGATALGCYGYSIDVGLNDDVVVGGYFLGNTMEVDSITLQNAGGYLIDPFLIKYRRNGDLAWANAYGRTAGETFYNIVIDSSGNIYASGSFDIWNQDMLPTVFGNDTLPGIDDWDLLFVKTDSLGTPLWAMEGGGNGLEEFPSQTLDIDESQSYILFGSGYWSGSLVIDSTSLTNSGSSTMDLFFGLFKEPPGSASGISGVSITDLVTVYPNPANQSITINAPGLERFRVKVYDLPGKEVIDLTLRESNPSFDVSHLETGIYVLQISKDNMYAVKRVVIHRN